MSNSQCNKFRIVLIGSTKVGKTSIINRFLKGQYDDHNKSTISAEYHSHQMNIEGTDIELQIWDTAGQERFKAIGPLYYRKAVVAIAVFDICDRVSLNDLDGWIESYRSSSDNPLVIIAGNKLDKMSEAQITFEEAENWAKAHNAEELIMTSAVSGEGISNLFDVTAKAILNNANKIHNIEVKPINSNDTSGPQKSGKCC